VTDSHQQRVLRFVPVLALAAVAFAVGAVVGSQSSVSPADALARAFAAAWARGDYSTMYSQIDERSRRSTSASDFVSAYEHALSTATATRVSIAGRARGVAGGRVAVPVRVQTRLFGVLHLRFELPIADAAGEGSRVSWSRSLAFPGLGPGELLSRSATLPRRATVLARDGSVLAESSGAGAARSSPLGELGSAVLGAVGKVPEARRSTLEGQGVPADATVGVSGLEAALDDRLRGTPGGELLAVDEHTRAVRKVLAFASAHAAPPLHSSVSPALQRAAVTALGGQLGGIVALQPATGQILAVAGLGLNGLQPPGSTFKMVTLTGVLQARLATPRTVFPYASYTTLDGVKLSNANGEECGGSLELAFAVSCNSVFAPLGVKLGARRLVAAAEQFGFNHGSGILGAPQSTIPASSQIEGELALGSTAIGQGKVLATPLQMAIVAATIADGGARPTPALLLGAGHGKGPRVISAAIARTVRRLMIGVVRSGTGTAAAIPGVVVAGKTGTAELKSQCSASGSRSAAAEPSSGETAPQRCAPGESEASNTDAWFAAFAPALHPRVAVCVLLVKDGAGGTTAAPVARQVLEAALSARS
jgi:cell division protein FtsI/penicillin-binding protein 2